MKIYRYHYLVGFPTNLKKPDTNIVIKNYSTHAVHASITDSYTGKIRLPKVINPRRATLIECDAQADGTIIKAVYRVAYGDVSDRRDIILVYNFEAETLVTAWLNLRSDNHTTLNSHLYDIPEGA